MENTQITPSRTERREESELVLILKLLIPGYIPFLVHKDIKEAKKSNSYHSLGLQAFLYAGAGVLEAAKLYGEYKLIVKPVTDFIRNIF